VTARGAKARRGSLEDIDRLKAVAGDSNDVIHVAHRQNLLPSGIDAVPDIDFQDGSPPRV
jgi:hypothetical protein